MIEIASGENIGKAAPTQIEAPRVSVGLPVYNGASTINVAISAILGQSFRDFELIISDNCSSDNTVEICEAAAKSDRRIRILRQKQNRGPVANFGAVLEAARAPFFMFAAADDWMEPHFIDETLSALEAVPEAVACAPRTLFHCEDGRCREARGSAPINGPGWWRPARFLMRTTDNSRFYGLYRTEVMRSTYLYDDRYYGLDVAVSAMTLAQGSHVQSCSIILHIHLGDPNKYYRAHLQDAPGLLDRLFPAGRMSAALLARLRPEQVPLAVPALLVYNVMKFGHVIASWMREHFGIRADIR